VTGDEVRQAFLRFFEEKGHTVLPSSSLIPHGDPTLLLTTAGMVQIKPYFLGLAPPPNPRLASCQKCFRTTDIESVGDTKHLTFFEMLGNFSVGDYFKKEAIEWGWEFVTDKKWLGIDPARLWITIYLDDDEAFDCWREIGVPAERIVRFGEKENFWGPAGDSGPCGPCSEIHYDYGEEYGCGSPDCGLNCDCPRFVEIWNLVFTQYDQDKDGNRTLLPKPNIDTGMGLERTAAMMQGKTSVFEADLFVPIVNKVCELAGKRYGENDSDDRAIRVVAEHARAVTFLIADGTAYNLVPGNEGRGYVLRRVLRRASLFGRKLGIKQRFLEEVAREVIESMGPVYPELKENSAHILGVIDEEELKFHETLDFSLNLFDGLLESRKDDADKTISGEAAFHFYDTYGLDREVQTEVAREKGFVIDWEGFEVEMEQQRGRARAARGSKAGEVADAPAYTGEPLPAIKFVGDDCHGVEHKGKVLQLTLKGDWKRSLFEGDEGDVYLDETPFYGEMGGQVGDTGELVGPEGRFTVEDTRRPWPELTIHRGRVAEGCISHEDIVTAKVDAERRLDIARNHTATHLLQAALRDVLGKHVHQAGSLVEPERLRFDFAHGGSLSIEEIKRVERIVNARIRQNLPVTCENKSYNQAVSEGAIALFGEKYGDEVRAVEIGEPTMSHELCGGTHVKSTGEIGLFRITTETSIGSGVRRIEAVTGMGAEEFVDQQLSVLQTAAEKLQGLPEQVPDKVARLQSELDAERKRGQRFEQQYARGKGKELAQNRKVVKGIPILAEKVPDMTPDSLRILGDEVKAELIAEVGPGSAIVLGTLYNNRPHFVAMATPDAVQRGYDSGDIVRQVAEITGGGGGGRPEMGQGSGKDKSKLDKAIHQAWKILGLEEG
jgi:alanyl-tRNA synthetase